MIKKLKMDGIEFLKDFADNSVKVAFFDPQYRGVLDLLAYGNEGKGRIKDRSALQQMSIETITLFIKEINRVLKKSGYLFLWIDKFHLLNDAESFHNWIKGTDLVVVDMVVWNKEKIGLGFRTRRTGEYLLILQKKPIKASSTWKLHNIPDIWSEKVVKKHPHSKPINLQSKLLEAVTDVGDLVIDPAGGGWSIADACESIGRDFIGSDLI